MPRTIEILGTVIFAVAVLHTFLVKESRRLANRFPTGSMGRNFFHLVGEVEIVFGVWASFLILIIGMVEGGEKAVSYVNKLNFTEPALVFVLLLMAGTRPIVTLATQIVSGLAKMLPLSKPQAFYLTVLIVGPLLGSLITEPAAMTVTALILKEVFFDKGPSNKFKYVTLAVLFVNISIGGACTPFAAPPILMVATPWNWDMEFMLTHFAWRVVFATVANALFAFLICRQDLKNLPVGNAKVPVLIPPWLTLLHVVFVALVVLTSHYLFFFIGVFLFFQGILAVTKHYQSEPKLRESMLVGFFLGGLVVLGSFQSWWLKGLLESLTEVPIFVGATILTGFVDNAALTYLGTQVPNLSDSMKYALVAGSIAGGGLTIIANAPNPAGVSILRGNFGESGIGPFALFMYAIPFTLIAMFFLWT